MLQALIGLEERERIEALQEQGRVINLLWDLRLAMWEKEPHGLKEEQSKWLSAVQDVSTVDESGGALTDRELSIVAQILAETAKGSKPSGRTRFSAKVS